MSYNFFIIFFYLLVLGVFAYVCYVVQKIWHFYETQLYIFLIILMSTFFSWCRLKCSRLGCNLTCNIFYSSENYILFWRWATFGEAHKRVFARHVNCVQHNRYVMNMHGWVVILFCKQCFLCEYSFICSQ